VAEVGLIWKLHLLCVVALLAVAGAPHGRWSLPPNSRPPGPGRPARRATTKEMKFSVLVCVFMALAAPALAQSNDLAVLTDAELDQVRLHFSCAKKAGSAGVDSFPAWTRFLRRAFPATC